MTICQWSVWDDQYDHRCRRRARYVFVGSGGRIVWRTKRIAGRRHSRTVGLEIRDDLKVCSGCLCAASRMIADIAPTALKEAA